MRTRSACIVLVGLLVMISLALTRPNSVVAQCDPAVPCPPSGDKEKKPKPVTTGAPPPVSTETPSCGIAILSLDVDGDTFGDQKWTIGGTCNVPDGYVLNNPYDCNDADASVHPGATDTCGDGVDQDCSGADTVCSTGALAPISSPCAGQGCGPSIPAPPFPAWMLWGGIPILGLLIGLLVRFRPR